MELDGPDDAALGQVHTLEAVAAIPGAIDTALGADEDGAGVVGVYHDGAHLRGGRHAPGQLLPAGIAGLLAIKAVRLGSDVYQCLACHNAHLHIFHSIW